MRFFNTVHMIDGLIEFVTHSRGFGDNSTKLDKIVSELQKHLKYTPDKQSRVSQSVEQGDVTFCPAYNENFKITFHPKTGVQGFPCITYNKEKVTA